MVELTKQMKNQCPQLANRPGHHGPAHTGHTRCINALKRREAKERNAKTPNIRRRRYRLVPADSNN